MTALRDQKGQITGFLAIATDISERKRAEDAQELAKIAAESANSAKSDFLAAMSQRNPNSHERNSRHGRIAAQQRSHFAPAKARGNFFATAPRRCLQSSMTFSISRK